MGNYVYGVSSEKISVQGLESPVYGMRYIYKPSYNPDLQEELEKQVVRKIGRYEAKPTMYGSFVSYFDKGERAGEIDIYIYRGRSNVFNDGNEALLTKVGIARKIGKRYTFVETQEYANP